MAVKVLEHKRHMFEHVSENSSAGSSIANPLVEAILSVNISHPNLIHSFKYASRPAPRGNGDAPKPTGGDDGEPDENELWETWIIQEYADMGTLQVRKRGRPW